MLFLGAAHCGERGRGGDPRADQRWQRGPSSPHTQPKWPGICRLFQN